MIRNRLLKTSRLLALILIIAILTSIWPSTLNVQASGTETVGLSAENDTETESKEQSGEDETEAEAQSGEDETESGAQSGEDETESEETSSSSTQETTEIEEETEASSEESSEEPSEESSEEVPEMKASVTYSSHVQSYGWMAVKKDGEVSGTEGQEKRMEAVKIQLAGLENVTGGIEYQVHVQSYGWMGWKANGAAAGTTGQAKRIESVRIRLTGDMAEKYDVYYRVHAQDYGWMGWAKNGATAGTTGMAKRLESMQVRLVKKGEAAPGSTANAYVFAEQKYTFTQKKTAAFSLYDTITDDAGRLVIIDGGYAENCDDIMAQIRKHGNHVYAWILTHYHDDHVEAFFKLLESGKLTGVAIDVIYAPDYDTTLTKKYPDLAANETFVLAEKWRKKLNSLNNVRFLDEGDELMLLDGLRMQVYHGWSSGKALLNDDSRRKQLINNTGLLFKLSSTDDSIMLTADVERIMEEGLNSKYGDHLQSEYVQCSHHGLSHGAYDQGFSADFYINTIKAVLAFIPNRVPMPTIEALVRELKEKNVPVKTTEKDNSVVLRTYNQQSEAGVAYSTHVQSYGWLGECKNSAISGTVGQAKRMEAIKIHLQNAGVSGGISYRTHVQSYGWLGWVNNGALSGTTGQAKRMEAIQIRLTGELAKKYDVYYRVHCQTYGWTGWVKNGATAGTTGQAKRLEAIQIKLVKK